MGKLKTKIIGIGLVLVIGFFALTAVSAPPQSAGNVLRTITPETDSTYYIGQEDLEWLYGYFDNLRIGESTTTNATTTGSLYVDTTLGLNNQYINNWLELDNYIPLANWEEIFGNALTPTTTFGIYVNASSTIAANFRVDGNATTTGSQEVGELLVGGVNLQGPSGATLVGIAQGVGSPTVDQLQERIDNVGSSGYFTGGIITDGGSGTIDITAGQGFIRTSANDNAPLLSFAFSASTTIDIPDNSTRYIFVDDAGELSLNASEFTEAQDNIMLGVATDEGSTAIHFFNLGVRLQESIGQMGRYTRRTDDIVRDKRKGGLIFGQSGDANRDVTVTAGSLWWGRTEYLISAFDTSGADTFETYSAGGQEAINVSQWPNEQYDNAGTLTTMINNRWAVLWFYIEPDDHIVMLYGRAQYVTEGQAEDELAPSSSIPPRISAASTIAAKFIFQKGEDIAAKVETAFDTPFMGSGVTDHGNLAGLGDDDHTQYLLADATRALTAEWTTNFGLVMPQATTSNYFMVGSGLPDMTGWDFSGGDLWVGGDAQIVGNLDIGGNMLLTGTVLGNLDMATFDIINATNITGSGTVAGGTITGTNVTSGTDPGHIHSGGGVAGVSKWQYIPGLESAITPTSTQSGIFVTASSTLSTLRIDNATVTNHFEADSTLYVKDSKVGIGTESPGKILHISDNSANRFSQFDSVYIEGVSTGGAPFGQSGSSGFGNGIVWRGRTFNDATIRDLARVSYRLLDNSVDTTFGTAITFENIENPTGSLVEHMVIDYTGNLGVGTTSPWGQLSIEGQGSKPELVVTGSDEAVDLIVDVNGNVGIGIESPSAKLEVSGSSIAISGTPPHNLLMEDTGGTSRTAVRLETFDTTEDRLKFGGGAFEEMTFEVINATPAMTIIDGGNVGIGTTTPLVKLEVFGNQAAIRVIDDNDEHPALELLAFSHDVAQLNYDNYWNGSSFVSSDAGSNYSIAKQSDILQFRVDSGNAAGATFAWTAPKTALAIHTDGDVGIGLGNTAPTAKLQVKVDASNVDGLIVEQGVSGFPSNDKALVYINSAYNGNNREIFKIQTDATNELFNVRHDGLVNIGMINGTRTLNVNGTIGWGDGTSELGRLSFTGGGGNPAIIASDLKDIEFWTEQSGAAAVSRMIITDTGQVGIGVTSINAIYKFFVNQGTDKNFGIRDVGGELSLEAVNDAINADVPLRIYASALSIPTGIVSIQQGSASDLATVGGVIFTDVDADVVPTTVTETTLKTFTMAANTLGTDGDYLQVHMSGEAQSSSGEDVDITIYFGATPILTISYGSGTVDTGEWGVDFKIFRRGASSQYVVGYESGDGGTQGTDWFQATAAIDLTAAVIIKVTGTKSLDTDDAEADTMTISWHPNNT